jgi:hypothetical protein
MSAAPAAQPTRFDPLGDSLLDLGTPAPTRMPQQQQQQASLLGDDLLMMSTPAAAARPAVAPAAMMQPLDLMGGDLPVMPTLSPMGPGASLGLG